MNDFRLISYGSLRFRTQHAITRCEKTTALLHHCVKPDDVIITHHAPSFLSVDEKFIHSPFDIAMNHGYVNYEADKILTVNKPKLWIHGHMHNTNDYVVNETRVISNPRGYFGHELNPDFDLDFVVEI